MSHCDIIEETYTRSGIDRQLVSILINALGSDLTLDTKFDHKLIAFAGNWRDCDSAELRKIIMSIASLSEEDNSMLHRKIAWKFVELNIPTVVNNNGNLEVVVTNNVFCSVAYATPNFGNSSIAPTSTMNSIVSSVIRSADLAVNDAVIIPAQTDIKKSTEHVTMLANWIKRHPPINGELKEDYKTRVNDEYKTVDNNTFGFALKQAGLLTIATP